MRVAKDTLITHEQAGGGGYGDAKERASHLIEDDLANGKISPVYAKQYYGV
jgi:N-methylhydantoinase B